MVTIQDFALIMFKNSNDKLLSHNLSFGKVVLRINKDILRTQISSVWEGYSILGKHQMTRFQKVEMTK